MSLALIVVSDTTLDNAPAEAQTLLMPNEHEVFIYHRVSNGQKGRGQAWQKVSVEALPTSPIKYTPTAVVTTDRDREMLSLGQVTNVGIKALYSLESATPNTDGTPHNIAVINLIERLYDGDNTLGDLIADKRRTNGVSLTPIVKAVEVESAPIIREVEPTTTMSVPLSNKTMVSQMVSVPDAKWAKEYIQRKVVGNLTEFDIYDGALANNKNVLIEGHAGSGKTMSVLAYASSRGMRYFNVA